MKKQNALVRQVKVLRKSEPFDIEDARETSGFVKLRLGHGSRGSIVAIDALFIQNERTSEWLYFIPSFFSAPRLVFSIPEGTSSGFHHKLTCTVDLAAPAATRAVRVELVLRSTSRVRSYVDGAQLYQCHVRHSEPLIAHSSGLAVKRDGDFSVRVFHHTKLPTVALIKKSGCFHGSQWNLQGTRTFANVCYAYFTSMQRIRNNEDLGRIAMASNGKLVLLGTGRLNDPLVELDVYRESTTGRTGRLEVLLPVHAIAPNPLLVHSPPFDLTYYEVVQPEVIRVALVPGGVLPFANGHVVKTDTNLKRFEYLVCGDASKEIGLKAPYDEEETQEVVHLERLETSDLFQFWLDHANSDQFSTRMPEPRLLL